MVSNQKIKNTRYCADCGADVVILDQERGELVCQNCGLVVSSEVVSNQPEWRAFNPVERDKLPRVGSPLTWSIHDKGLSTEIGWSGRDGMGRRLGKEERARLYRLRRWQQRSKVADSINRNLSHALRIISGICFDLSLPRNVMETSSILYRRALQHNAVRGRTINCVSAACVYMACRKCGVVRTLEDVANSVKISKKQAARNYRFLLKEMEVDVPLVGAEMYIGKLVNALKLSGDTEKVACLILSKASKMRLTSGRGPGGMAAACIYIATYLTNELRTQGLIAELAQVTEVTIRNRYKELISNLDLLIDV